VTSNSANVRSAITGAVYVGAVATPAPTTHISTLNAALKDLGYVSEDGVAETRDRTTKSIQAWQNGDKVREVVTEAGLSYKFVLLETKKETVETFYGSAVNPTDGSIIIVPANTGGRKAWVVDVIDGTSFIRTWIPQGEITEVGDLVYQNGEPIGYEHTLTAYPDATLGGTAKKWYSDLVVTP
jgi:hypothetical protein